jgi:hypothetical protein
MPAPLWIQKLWRKSGLPKPRDIALFSSVEGTQFASILPQRLLKEFNQHYFDDTSEPEKYDAGQLHLIESVSQTPTSNLSVDQWFAGFRLLIAQGCFRLGGAFREQAVKLSLAQADERSADKDSLINGFAAAIDQARLDQAKLFLDGLRSTKKVGQITLNRLTSYLSLHHGDLESFLTLCPEPELNTDKAFMEYIKGRSVAIVGPAPGASDGGTEIDSFDLVSRSNHRGRDTTYIPETAGSRTDFSFYAHGHMLRINRDKNAALFDTWIQDLDWAVPKNLDYPFLTESPRKEKIVLRRWNQLFVHGHPNLTPSNLYTLLYFKARRVKVFNSNFYLSKNPYSPNYSNTLSTSRMFGSMAGHDCASQVNFMRSLSKAGLVEMDTESSDVLAISTSAYLSGLESLFKLP